MNDQQAIERYRYLLRTAPPDEVERAHAEAFAQLTPDQRRTVLNELGAQVPPGERAATDDPKDLARMATRAEIRQPGTLERTFGGMQGPGLGGFFLSTMAGAFVGTAIAGAMFGPDTAGDPAQTDDAATTDGAASGDADTDGGDVGGGDVGGGDVGGGDFGGGDFGGGDIGF